MNSSLNTQGITPLIQCVCAYSAVCVGRSVLLSVRPSRYSFVGVSVSPSMLHIGISQRFRKGFSCHVNALRTRCAICLYRSENSAIWPLPTTAQWPPLPITSPVIKFSDPWKNTENARKPCSLHERSRSKQAENRECDGWTANRWMDGRTDGRTLGHSILLSINKNVKKLTR